MPNISDNTFEKMVSVEELDLMLLVVLLIKNKNEEEEKYGYRKFTNLKLLQLMESSEKCSFYIVS